MTSHDLKILTEEELLNLAESVTSLKEARLMPTWAYVQSLKYNGLIEQGNCTQPNWIFQSIELPIIKRLYPPELVNVKVKKWISYLSKKSSLYSKDKLIEYVELRKYGLTIDEARSRLGTTISDQMMLSLAAKYKMPFKYQYKISCRDADVLFSLGIDRFIQLFYDRFYQPVTT